MNTTSPTPAYQLDPESFDPTTHPKWERQVEFERYMLKAGAERFRAKLTKAKAREEMTRLQPYRSLMQEWIGPVSEGVGEWITAQATKRGRARPIALPLIKLLPADTIAFVTVRTVLDRMAMHKVKLLPVAFDIGNTLQHEWHMQEWEKRNPDLFYDTQNTLDKQHATAPHRRRVNINRFNKLIRGDFELSEWDETARKHLGLACIDILVRNTKRFTVVPDPTFRARRGSAKEANLVIAPTGDLTAWINAALENAEVSTPFYLPTLIPPKPWTGPKRGAYYTPFIRTPDLIRFKAAHQTQRRHAIDEYRALDMPLVYEALNFVQNTPWQINRRVLDVAERLWKADLGMANLPKREAKALPPKPHDIDTNPEALKFWKREAAQVHGDNARRISHVIAAQRIISIATLLRNEQEFYFPHILDFRGRFYPVPVGLNPQGNDFARGVLEFAEGKPVMEATSGWLGIQLANCWGNDKVSFDERLAWAMENRTMWEAIAADPIENRQWMTSPGDTPWQALAAIFDLVAYWQHGDGYVSHQVIRVDGTCNGIQHLSAMIRDEEGGASVNLLPGDRPRDIYKEVADVLTVKLKQIAEAGGEEGAKAQEWLDLCDGDLPRSLTKRPVMIMPYGGTKDAYLKYIREWLKDKHPGMPWDRSSKLCLWIAPKMWNAVSAKVTGGRLVMEWLKKAAGVAASSGKPLYWVTPSGFVVRQFYGKLESRRVTTRIDGRLAKLVAWETTEEMSKPDQLRGIAPNFVHSMDASALTLAMLSMRDAGYRSVTSIHDSYGTLVADMGELEYAIRLSFVEMYEANDVLTQFAESCQYVAPSGRTIPHPPPFGTLSINGALNSPYFFA